MGIKHVAALAALFSFSACSTVGVPVLRHETGEILGQKKFRVYGHYETSRLLTPAVPSGTSQTEQKSDAFQSSLLGFQADAGVYPKLDLQLGANFTLSGGGWRTGAKYQVYRNGRLAIAGMAGYGASSGSGTVTYLTSGTPVEVFQSLSLHTLDFSVPVSFRISPGLALYSGLMYFWNEASGSLGDTFVSDVSNDIGTNFGLKFNYWIFEGDLEAAFLRVHDPFMDGTRYIPYLGCAVGVTF